MLHTQNGDASTQDH